MFVSIISEEGKVVSIDVASQWAMPLLLRGLVVDSVCDDADNNKDRCDSSGK